MARGKKGQDSSKMGALQRRGQRRAIPLATAVIIAALLPAPSAAVVSTVSIDEGGTFNNVHPCVRNCLFAPEIYTDAGSALACAYPYDNHCYCATAVPSVSKLASFITACASTSCDAGDLTNDITNIETIYASYCASAGFVQPIVTGWIGGNNNDNTPSTTTPSPGQSPDATSPSTSTDLTLVTQTSTTNSAGDLTTGNPSSPCKLIMLVAGVASGVAFLL